MTNNQCIKTATHELGHALGFLGHVKDDTAIMKQGFISIFTLTDMDILHLQQIYNQEGLS
jgi:predicted Zn-dependent protease